MNGLQQIILVHPDPETAVLIARDENGALWRGYALVTTETPNVVWTRMEEHIQ